MGNNGNSLYDDLEKAQAKLIMLRDSCDAIFRAQDYDARPHIVSEVWFEGASHVCREIIEVLYPVLDRLEKEEASKERTATETPEASQE